MYSPSFNLSNYYEVWGDEGKGTQSRQYNQPPLSAYTADFPGSRNYTNQTISINNSIRLSKLNGIKYYGYKTLKPIGIEKTMEQIDYEHDLAAEGPDNGTMGNSLENDDSNIETNIPTSLQDIDQDMPDLDNTDDDLDNLDEDDGFMADEVEYQNDHSLRTSTIGPTGAAISSGASTGTGTVSTLASGFSAGAPISTPATAVEPHEPECEEDMSLDEE